MRALPVRGGQRAVKLRTVPVAARGAVVDDRTKSKPFSKPKAPKPLLVPQPLPCAVTKRVAVTAAQAAKLRQEAAEVGAMMGELPRGAATVAPVLGATVEPGSSAVTFQHAPNPNLPHRPCGPSTRSCAATQST